LHVPDGSETVTHSARLPLPDQRNPQTARARSTDLATSHGAAASVKDITKVQARVLALFHYLGPMTDYELCHHFRLMVEAGDYPPATDQSIRSRRAELVAALRLRATTAVAYTLHGRRATVWEVAQ